MNPIHVFTSCSRNNLISSSHLRLGLLSCLSPSGFPTKVPCISLHDSVYGSTNADARSSVDLVSSYGKAQNSIKTVNLREKRVSAPPPPKKRKSATPLYTNPVARSDTHTHTSTDADTRTRTHVGLHAEVSVVVV